MSISDSVPMKSNVPEQPARVAGGAKTVRLSKKADLSEKVESVASESFPGKITRIRKPITEMPEGFSKFDLLPTQNSFESLNWKYQLLSVAKNSIEFSPNFCGDIEFQVCLLKIEKQMEKYPELKVHILASPDFLKTEDVDLINHLHKKFPTRFNPLCTDRKFQISPVMGTTEVDSILQQDMMLSRKFTPVEQQAIQSSVVTKTIGTAQQVTLGRFL